MLESTLRKCFDARLISIHPETRKVRAFLNLGIITKVHGRTATLSESIPKKVLQHYWDMCCLENTVSSFIPWGPKLVTDKPELPTSADLLKTFGKDLFEDDTDHAGHGRRRGRSRVTKRCTATEENDESGMKRQRVE